MWGVSGVRVDCSIFLRRDEFEVGVLTCGEKGDREEVEGVGRAVDFFFLSFFFLALEAEELVAGVAGG